MKITSVSLALTLLCISCDSSTSDGEKMTCDPVLSADREAPIGWVKFDAYPDRTFTYSLDTRDKRDGTYKLKGDTLFLTFSDTLTNLDLVVVEENSLHFVGRQTPEYAAITINTLTK